MQGTLSKDKNELLFQQFQMNYNNEPAMFRKGSCIYRQKVIFTDFVEPLQLQCCAVYAVPISV